MELWDIYDSHRRKTGRLHKRGEILKPGDYHLVVGVAVYNRTGQILITKRSPEKRTDPGKWENTVGSVLAGEDSLAGACRELYEETGLIAAAEDMRLIYQLCGTGYSGKAFADIYIVKVDEPPEEIRLQPGETCDAKWMDAAQWYQGIQEEEIRFLWRDQKEKIADTVMEMMNNKENE